MSRLRDRVGGRSPQDSVRVRLGLVAALVVAVLCTQAVSTGLAGREVLVSVDRCRSLQAVDAVVMLLDTRASQIEVAAYDTLARPDPESGAEQVAALAHGTAPMLRSLRTGGLGAPDVAAVQAVQSAFGDYLPFLVSYTRTYAADPAAGRADAQSIMLNYAYTSAAIDDAEHTLGDAVARAQAVLDAAMLRARTLSMLIAGVGTTLVVALGLRTIASITRPLRDAYAAVSVQASTDELTGLANRRAFYRDCEAALVAAGPGAPVSVLMVDLDGFKQVNDELGHAAGDELLQQVAARLRSALCGARPLARLGGDEFAAVLPGVDADGAAAAVARVTARMGGFTLDGVPVRVRASLGAATTTEVLRGRSALMQEADAAMYRAKAAARATATTAGSPSVSVA